jgi:hypothetical protein
MEYAPAFRVSLRLIKVVYDGSDETDFPLSAEPLSNLALRPRFDARVPHAAGLSPAPTRSVQLIRRSDGAVLAFAAYPTIDGRVGGALRGAEEL